LLHNIYAATVCTMQLSWGKIPDGLSEFRGYGHGFG